jgi:RNA polymerase sigma factor (sigma-70 family)
MIHPRELLDQLAALQADAFRWAVTCCAGDPAAGEDVLQESYIKVATGRATFAEKSSLKTWWLAVVRHTAAEHLRRDRRWRRIADVFRDWISSLSNGASAEAQEPLGSTPVNADQLAAALRQLPSRQAEVLHLVFQQSLSLSETATVLGISVGSARQHYERAKKRLRQLLSTALAHPPVCDHAT